MTTTGPEAPASTGVKIGYARVSTDLQSTAVQVDLLLSLGVEEGRIYTDEGYTGRTVNRPGLAQALAAVRESDILVVAKLDRLGRSLKDLIAVSEALQARGVRLQIGSQVYDPADPIGRLLFSVLGMVAEFEADLIRARTKEGLERASRQGRLLGRRPSTTPQQEALIARMLAEGEHTPGQIAEIMGVSRSTVYRAKDRAAARSGSRSGGEAPSAA